MSKGETSCARRLPRPMLRSFCVLLIALFPTFPFRSQTYFEFCEQSDITEYKMNHKIGPEQNYWTLFQLDLMMMVQRHPVTYIRDFVMTPPQYKAALTAAWAKIARDMRKTQRECTQNWTSIKFRYAKVNNMIHDEKVSEEIIKLHPKTGKYLDGCLDFMDAYIDEIDDDEIPLSIHKRFNKMFGLDGKHVLTKEMVLELIRQRDQEEDPDDEMGRTYAPRLNLFDYGISEDVEDAEDDEDPENPEDSEDPEELEDPEDNVAPGYSSES